MPRGFILSPTAAQKVSRLIRNVDITAEGEWLKGGHRKAAPMPLDCAIIGGTINVRIRDTNSMFSPAVRVRYGYSAWGVGVPVAVDSALYPALATAVNTSGQTWYDTGITPIAGGTGIYFYIRDTADYSDVSTSGPTLVWGIAEDTTGITASTIRLWILLATCYSSPARVEQMYHGNVSAFAGAQTLRPFKENSDGDYIAASSLSFSVVTDVRLSGGAVQTKTRTITITKDGRFELSAETSWT